jgi:PAS domain S-box-containing protein
MEDDQLRVPKSVRLAPYGFAAATGLLAVLGFAGALAVAQAATVSAVVLWMLPSVVVGTIFVAFGTASLQGAIKSGRGKPAQPTTWLYVAVFVLFALTVSIAASLYVIDLRSTVRNQRLLQQADVAALKAQLVQNWLARRSMDTQLLTTSLRGLRGDFSELGDVERSIIDVVFAQILAGSPERIAVKLFRPDGTLVAQAGEPADPNEGARTASIARDHPAGARVAIVERLGESDGRLRLDFVHPLAPPRGSQGAAILVVSTDPAVALLPEVLRWPSDSATSEILIVRRQGNEFATLARSRPDSRGAASTSFLSTLVANDDAVRVARDDRGLEVLVASRRIAPTNLLVIAKTDVAEALLPIENRSLLVTVLTAAAIVVAAIISIGLWRVDRARYAALGARHALSEATLMLQYRQMMQRARDVVLLTDNRRRIVDANPEAIATYGYSLEELRDLHFADLVAPQERERIDEQWPKLFGGQAVAARHRRKDGREFAVEMTGSSFEVDGRHYWQAFVRKAAAGTAA